MESDTPANMWINKVMKHLSEKIDNIAANLNQQRKHDEQKNKNIQYSNALDMKLKNLEENIENKMWQKLQWEHQKR